MPEPRKDWNSDAMAMAARTYLKFWARVDFSDVVVVYSSAEEKRSRYEMTSSMPDAGRQVILRVQPKAQGGCLGEDGCLDEVGSNRASPSRSQSAFSYRWYRVRVMAVMFFNVSCSAESE